MFPERIIYKIFETEHHGKGLIFVFQDIFGSTDKIFILWGGGSTRSKSLEIFQRYSNFLRSEVLIPSATPKGTCIYLFNSNNYDLFHLWSKESLLSHQKVSKYYEFNCMLIRIYRI